MDISGKVAFISGGGGGIGGALAEALAKAGAKVAVSDFDLSRASAVSQRASAFGETCAIMLDVTDSADWQQARQKVESVLGPVDILCSNAGVGYTAPLDEISDDAFRWVHDVNVMGTVRALRTFLPGMKARGEAGHVLLTCSITALRPYATQSAYTSSKAALLNLALTLEMELAGTAIGVSALCPGMVATDLRANAEAAKPDVLKRNQPVQVGASPLSAGMSPVAVARAAIAAITDGRFYVFTHADYREGLAAEQSLIIGNMIDSADPNYVEPASFVVSMHG